MQKKRLRVPFDLEWWYGGKGLPQHKDGEFRCASWLNYGNLWGTHKIEVFANFMSQISHLPVIFVGHYVATADLKQCVRWGIPLPADFEVEDSFIAGKFLDPNQPLDGLKKVGKLYGYVYRDRHDVIDPTELLDYCGKDTFTSAGLAEIYTQRAKEEGKYHAVEMYQKFSLAFACMELAGLKLNVPALRKKSEQMARRLTELVPTLPDPKMVTDDNVMRSWLESEYPAEQIAMLPTSFKSKETSIGKKHLALLRPQTETLARIAEARELDNMKKLFVDGPLNGTYDKKGKLLRKPVDERGFDFPRIKLLETGTQRRATSPNYQNWPDAYRRNIISRFPDGKIVSLDYMNLEARIFGWQAGCDDFVNDLKEGGYKAIAERCLGIIIKDKKDPRYRDTKSTILAMTYNMGYGLYAFRQWIDAKGEGEKMSWKAVKAKYDVVFNKYPKLHDEMERRKAFAWEHNASFCSVVGAVALPIIPDDLLPDDEEWIKKYRKKVENWAINHPTQRLASYVTGCALYDVYCGLAHRAGGWGRLMDAIYRTTQEREPAYPCFLPIMEVHDALVFDSQSAYAKECEEEAAYIMTEGKSLKQVCPDFDTTILATESKVASTWDGEPDE